MKKLILFLFILISYSGFSQTMTIKATVLDTNVQMVVPNALGIVTRVRDSVLLGFQRADKYGKFEISFPMDTVEFVVKHPEFGVYRSFLFGSPSNLNFEMNPLIMPDKSTNIDEVVIFANKNPIYYRGDTLVYVADSFQVKENAVVEDLIRKLPGMTIDANGKITNQGKEIGQVLVDGDEFFGSDPTIATKNLAAKGVQTVEVYEKDAEDGSDEKIQVLDLKLKEEAKKGYFGKVNLAGGLDKFVPSNKGFYEGEFLLNKYNSKQKIAVFGLASNTPKTNFNGSDLYKFGISEGGDWGNETDDLQTYTGSAFNENEGIPSAIKAGFYLDQKLWKGGRVRLNYSFSEYNVLSKTNSRSQYILTDTSYTTDQSVMNKDAYKQNEIGIKFTQKLDSTSRIEIEPKLTLNNTTQNNNSYTQFISQRDTLTRTTDISQLTKSTGAELNTTVRYFKDFKKKGRKLNVRYNFDFNNNASNGTLVTADTNQISNSINTLYSFDQRKENRLNSLAQTGYIDYFEPIGKKWKAEFDYEYYSNNNDQTKSTFNGQNGQYTTIDSTFSNGFQTNRQQHRIGAFGIFENAKTRVSFGTRLRTIGIDNQNIFLDTNIRQDLTNLLPRVVIQHKFSQTSRLRFQYNTTSALPSVTQLQPVRDNSNPNSIQIGNSNLKPNYSHTGQLNYNMWKGLSGFYTYSGLSYTRQLNAFSSSTYYDAFGRTVSQSINVDHADYSYLYGGVGIPIPKVKDLRLDINVNGNFSASENYINTLKNSTKNYGIGSNFNFRYNADSLNLELGTGFDYNAPKNSLSTMSNQPYTTYSFNGLIDWTLPGKWFVKTDATYTLNTGRTAGYNTNFLIWNASIQRAFLKTGNLLFGIEAYDILNQNISNYRTVSNNVIVDQQTNIIRRYFMAKMTLKFNNNHTTEKEDDDWF